MSELLVGLVAIMLLLVGLLQVSFVSRTSFDAYTNVREGLARQVADPMADYSGEFLFAESVDRGRDEKNYTGDDSVVVGDDSFFTEGNGLLESMHHTDMWQFLDMASEAEPEYEHDPYHLISDAFFYDLSVSFSMFYAADRQSVKVVPFLNKVIGRDEINLKQEAWMPSWRGLRELK